MILGVPKEADPTDPRVALVPELVPKLASSGFEVLVQICAGLAAGFPDALYAEQGAHCEEQVINRADVVLKVQPPTLEEIGSMRSGATLISCLKPLAVAKLRALAERKITAFAMELIPRISRAQSMDALTSMSTVAGYKAVLLAACRLPKFFPLMMTPAGTIAPARVFVIGAGVAGLQAIGTAKRLGAIVEAYDTRPTTREHAESLGANFVDLGIKPRDAEGEMGYAAAQAEDFYREQQRALSKYVRAADVVISTALVPGRPAPMLITAEMVRGMRPGSVIVDLAVEQGGNCALTKPGEEVVRHDVLIIGLRNLPGTVPFHASQLYARNLVNFLLHLVRDGAIHIGLDDELTRAPLVAYRGEILYQSPEEVPAHVPKTD